MAARPDGDGALAEAELSYRAGIARQATQPLQALAWYRDAAALAALALRESGGARDDAAIRVHNQAATRLIRIAQAEAKRTGGEWRQVLEAQGVALSSPTPDLAPDRFADLLIVDDVRVEGMQHVYRTEGLGRPARCPPPGRADGLARPSGPLPPPRAPLRRHRADHADRQPDRSGLAAQPGDARAPRPLRRPVDPPWGTATSPWPATGRPLGSCRWPRGTWRPSN